ncbi:hypothetical protein H4217_003425 [Coemansia sp. RSA 1939]|nr:hypothetical protein H4217_003425 [Coemansia sp. RSA 1939]
MRTFNSNNHSSFSSASDMLSSRNSRCSAGADRMPTESPAASNVSASAEHCWSQEQQHRQPRDSKFIPELAPARFQRMISPLEGISATRLCAKLEIERLNGMVGPLEEELEDANHALEIETSVTRQQKSTIAELNARNAELEEKLTRAESSAAIWKREVMSLRAYIASTRPTQTAYDSGMDDAAVDDTNAEYSAAYDSDAEAYGTEADSAAAYGADEEQVEAYGTDAECSAAYDSDAEVYDLDEEDAEVYSAKVDYAATYDSDADHIYGMEDSAAYGSNAAYGSDAEIYDTDSEEDEVYASDELDQITDELEAIKGMCYTLERQFLDSDNNTRSKTLPLTPPLTPQMHPNSSTGGSSICLAAVATEAATATATTSNLTAATATHEVASTKAATATKAKPAKATKIIKTAAAKAKAAATKAANTITHKRYHHQL